jgi:hypothetical protein
MAQASEHIGAHGGEFCQEVMRTAKISAAGQTAYRACTPRSQGCLHQTRPTGRLTPGCQASGRSLPGSRATAGGSSWVTGAGPEMIRFRGAGTAALAGAAYGGTAGEGCDRGSQPRAS